MQHALSCRHMGKVIKAYRTHPHHGRQPVSQERVAEWIGTTQAQLSRIENGPPLAHLDRLIQWAALLGIPSEHLWFKLPEQVTKGRPVRQSGDQSSGDPGDDVRRRTLLAGTAAGMTLPVIGLDHLRQIAALLDDARRSFEGTDIEYFRHQLAECANNDGATGPNGTLPVVLGIIAAIEHASRDAASAARCGLLAVGARSAEFAGWLYRDIGLRDTAEYWRDRAMEWAQAAGDDAMQGYILLKKSQAAWDERDAVWMLTLAQAAQNGPWRLPARVRAEAVQQEARGLAMLGDDIGAIDRKLEAAHELLATGAPEEEHTSELRAHYDPALLALQTAICHCEAGRPERAVEV